MLNIKSYFKILVTFQLLAIIVAQCSSGYYLSGTSCRVCPDGYYCPNPTTDPIPCPPGSISNSNYVKSQCRLCSSGYYADKPASTVCTVCPDGSFCRDPSIPPTLCPPGTISDSNYVKSQCRECSPGYYADKEGSTRCTVCPDGSFCRDPSIPPTPCPLGTYSTYMYVKSSCIKCSPGYYADKEGSASCKVCPDGSFCCNPRLSPTPCPPGTMSDSMYVKSQCRRCSSGYYADNEGSTRCTVCPDGYYCCDATQPPIKCPIGTISNSMYVKSQCRTCSNGYYTPTSGSTACTSCSSSLLCPTNSPAPQCLPLSLPSLACSDRDECPPEDLSCLAATGECSFYTELEKKKGCGAQGYLQNYGKKYCEKFSENYNDFNSDGKLWVDSVRKCLMNKLLDNELSCDALKTYAFDTHVDCYLKPGYYSKSICDIWQSQNFVGLWNVYDLKDFFSADALKQVVKTMASCASGYVESIGSGFLDQLQQISFG